MRNFFLLKGIVLLYIICSIQSVEGNKLMYSIPDNCDFSNVNGNSLSSNECSPKLDDPLFSEFRGIVINVQKNVKLKSSSEMNVLKLAGLLYLNNSVMKSNGKLQEKVVVVAVDQYSSKSYSGRMKNPRGLVGAKGGTVNNDNPSLGYFNLDLIDALGIPLSDSEYVIYATVGEFKSNAVMVKVEVE